MRTSGPKRARIVHRLVAWTLALGVILIFFSCTKLTTPREPTVTVEKLTDFGSIPSGWGRLVSVSNRADVGHVFHLWFQDTDGTIRVVKYNDKTDQLLPKVVLISRK
jgi:hypothetical protein